MTTTKINFTKYRCSNEIGNYLSVGCKNPEAHKMIHKDECTHGGIFRFNQDELFEIIAKTWDTPQGKSYCFAERKSEYFMLFYDFDIDKYLPANHNIDVVAFIQYLINKLIKSLI